jgi:hypothetical protein
MTEEKCESEYNEGAKDILPQKPHETSGKH